MLHLSDSFYLFLHSSKVIILEFVSLRFDVGQPKLDTSLRLGSDLITHKDLDLNFNIRTLTLRELVICESL